MEIVSVRRDGTELGMFRDIRALDVDVGSTNDFVMTFSAALWSSDILSEADYWYLDNNGEIGGRIGSVKSITAKKQIQLQGYTWRGLLDKHIIEPPTGEDYRIVSGEANDVLRQLIEPCFGGLYVVPASSSGFTIKKHQFKRYETLLSGAVSMLYEVGAKLDIRYVPGEYNGNNYTPGYVRVSAVPIIDYSEEIMFSQDGKIDFTAQDYKMGVNHLIALGKGDLRERQVIHLYADRSGNIGKNQTYFGADEIAAVYDYSAAESLEDLERYAVQRIKELGNYTSLQIALNKVQAQIGDIVGGQEQITGITLKKQIAQIIVKVDSKGKLSITHKVGD